ncbi:Flp pilus assembly protein TadD [Rubellimicrobium mesophilum DSM 19309]|uniref:Flp pilus assembly protein TadD n=1 Tax=Rubellimicrobium mesophilum DSM 19309 TaxID=442562 RepID=A0A017HUL4_9RHOB|nr:tetratricopeptide repeat protein [Rubellimicrobium mesophilum]EYD77858.1 Flp pilus assembly protein TadD [Rubellimicrobium mesophilum DSM 19309]
MALAFALLAGCEDAGLNRSAGGVYAPGLAPGEEADQLQAGHRLMAAGQYQLALDAYMRAAAHEGLTPDTLAGMGSADLRLGRLGQAEDLLRRAVEEDPTFVPAWNNLGVLLMEREKYGEASEVFRRAYAADSGNSDTIRDNLRLALARMDDRLYSGVYDGEGGSVTFNDVSGGARLIGIGDEEALSPEEALESIEPL